MHTSISNEIMITSDEVNYLIYRYLAESGFSHTQFTFLNESALDKRNIRGSQVRAGALINLIQKGLQFTEVECHVNEDGTEKKCKAPFKLLEQHECVLEDGEKQEGRSTKKTRRDETAGAKNSRPQKQAKTEKRVRKESAAASSTEAQPDLMEGFEESTSEVLVVTKYSASETILQCTWNPAKPSIVAAGTRNGKVRLWQVPAKPPSHSITVDEDGEELTMGDANIELSGDAKAISALEWAPSGALLAAGTVDGRTLVWTRSGELKFAEKRHSGAVMALAWNSSGTYIVTGSHDKESIMWDAETGQVRQRFAFHDGPILSADWLDDETFATSSSDAQIYLCHFGDIEPLKQFSHKKDVNKVVWDNSKKYLASCSDDGTAKIWTAHSDEPTWVIKGHEKDIVTCQWSPSSDKLLLVTAGVDRTLRLWDVNKQECLHVFRNHDAEVLCVDFSANGQFLASASADGRVNVWSIKSHSLVKTYQGDKGEDVNVQAKWNKQGDKLALACGHETISVIHL